MSEGDVLEKIGALAERWADERRERQERRDLDPADFEALHRAGLLRMSLPVSRGGLWRSLPASLRPWCEALRVLARGDGSVALVVAMHPTVLLPWLERETGEGPGAWGEQCDRIFASVAGGAWWGTIKSEPGSGGDPARTRTRAHPTGAAGPGYRIRGEKHFGSGAGVVSFFVTVAVPEGEEAPDVFVLDMRGVPWDGSTGARLTAEWDGMGMRATQSHAFRFDGFPAERIAWSAAGRELADPGTAFDQCAFAAVALGIVDAALEAASLRVAGDDWSRAELARAREEARRGEEVWAGAIRAVERDEESLAVALRAKLTLAELAPRVLERICRAVGGSSYSRRQPFGPWLEDVRALGFLRPPWALAVRRLATLEREARAAHPGQQGRGPRGTVRRSGR